MREDLAFGIIPLQRDRVFIVHHTKGFWGFPKGHAEKGESPFEAAKRELFEETGLHVINQVITTPYWEQYTYEWGGETVKKTVNYFVCTVEGESVLQLEEVDQGLFLQFEEAEKKLTYKEAKRLLHKLKEEL